MFEKQPFKQSNILLHYYFLIKYTIVLLAFIQILSTLMAVVVKVKQFRKMFKQTDKRPTSDFRT